MKECVEEKGGRILPVGKISRDATHGIRNEKQASDQRNEHHVLLTSRQEEEKRERKKRKKPRRAVWPDKKDDPSETQGRKWAEEPSRREHSGRE
jgi:hypothetical protein